MATILKRFGVSSAREMNKVKDDLDGIDRRGGFVPSKACDSD